MLQNNESKSGDPRSGTFTYHLLGKLAGRCLGLIHKGWECLLPALLLAPAPPDWHEYCLREIFQQKGSINSRCQVESTLPSGHSLTLSKASYQTIHKAHLCFFLLPLSHAVFSHCDTQQFFTHLLATLLLFTLLMFSSVAVTNIFHFL